jgi:enamine deaminase RidA (YjgF/YER057c/UK114 family)
VQDRSQAQGRQSVKSFQEILESASMLLAQVVSLGSRLSSASSRALQGLA